MRWRLAETFQTFEIPIPPILAQKDITEPDCFGILVFMKATIEFEDELYRRLKASAALRGKKVRELVNDAVRKSLQSAWSPAEDGAAKDLPLIGTPRKKPLSIRDDVASRMDADSDRESHAASLR